MPKKPERTQAAGNVETEPQPAHNTTSPITVTTQHRQVSLHLQTGERMVTRTIAAGEQLQIEDTPRNQQELSAFFRQGLLVKL